MKALLNRHALDFERHVILKQQPKTSMLELRQWLIDRSFVVPERVNVIELGARAALWMGLLVLGWGYVFESIQRSQESPTFVHFLISRVNLVFHEAGHIVFALLGDLIAALGGSLMQVLVPLVCAATFLRHLNSFGAAVATWWAGESLIELAPYIDDARSQQLELLGGVTGSDAPGYHDWNNVLSRLGLLAYDHGFAKAAHLSGVLLILLGLAWGGYLLLLQYRNRESLR